jgi:hypothetical protein
MMLIFFYNILTMFYFFDSNIDHVLVNVNPTTGKNIPFKGFHTLFQKLIIELRHYIN